MYTIGNTRGGYKYTGLEGMIEGRGVYIPIFFFLLKKKIQFWLIFFVSGLRNRC